MSEDIPNSWTKVNPTMNGKSDNPSTNSSQAGFLVQYTAKPQTDAEGSDHEGVHRRWPEESMKMLEDLRTGSFSQPSRLKTESYPPTPSLRSIPSSAKIRPARSFHRATEPLGQDARRTNICTNTSLSKRRSQQELIGPIRDEAEEWQLQKTVVSKPVKTENGSESIIERPRLNKPLQLARKEVHRALKINRSATTEGVIIPVQDSQEDFLPIFIWSTEAADSHTLLQFSLGRLGSSSKKGFANPPDEDFRRSPPLPHRSEELIPQTILRDLHAKLKRLSRGSHLECENA